MMEDVRLYYGGHVFVLRGEGKAVDDGCPLANLLIVDALGMEPQQEGTLGGVADSLRVGRVGEVEVGGGVHGYHLGQKLFCMLRLRCHKRGNPGLCHLHLVLGEGAGLVRADIRGSSHRLAGVHGAWQGVLLHQLAHGEGQTEGDTHGQTFGNGHDDERDGNHERVEHVSDEVEPVEGY